MGWGEPQGPPPELIALRRQLDAGRTLAAAVRAWLADRTTTSEQAVEQALQSFDGER